MSVFLDFQLPSPATWFYWSLLLSVTLFFQFRRPLALRNFDLLTLYLFVPGVLLVQSGNGHEFTGYVCLLAASAYWLVRSLIDGALKQRPLYRANLNGTGLTWFGLALFVVLIGVTIRKPAASEEMIGRSPAAISVVKDQATAVVSQANPPGDGETVRLAVERGLALLGHAAVALGLIALGWRHFRDAEAGVAMATLYLLVPYTGYHVGQLHHVLPAALVLWAVVYFHSATTSGLLLGLAAGTTFFPVLLFPVWLRLHWRRSAGRFAISFVSAIAVGLGLTLLVFSPEEITRALHLTDWQPWKQPASEGLWRGVHWAYRLPVFILFAGFLLAIFVWPVERTLGQAAALSAAVLIGIQFWYAERGGMYVLWYLPLLIVMTVRPTTAELELPVTGAGWAPRWLRTKLERVRPRSSDSNPPALAG